MFLMTLSGDPLTFKTKAHSPLLRLQLLKEVG